jgi:hypothetical protein
MNCPKCNKPVEPSGELVMGDVVLEVFQCDEEQCLVSFELGGKSFPAAFTFAVSEEGEYFCPDTMEPIEPA